MDDYEHCAECEWYGDDYYYDEETDEWLSACDRCPFNGIEEWSDDYK